MAQGQSGDGAAGDFQTLHVAGMTCQGCVRSVTAAAERVAPGTVANVDLGRGEVRLRAPVSAETHAALARAIEAAGFEVAGG